MTSLGRQQAGLAHAQPIQSGGYCWTELLKSELFRQTKKEVVSGANNIPYKTNSTDDPALVADAACLLVTITKKLG